MYFFFIGMVSFYYIKTISVYLFHESGRNCIELIFSFIESPRYFPTKFTLGASLWYFKLYGEIPRCFFTCINAL
ncbi:Uncharacterised protein [Vibrio cholerae]|uniref:Uncharacterized protein n=1 Tax=Vibrio cholerae TaxID=666 RepID=A0A656APU5_VIBCL|nr:Uncharacterised protein [Vibrio cholerae]CSD25337.1 Uncharacterised protein [Vibrio cholerae]